MDKDIFVRRFLNYEVIFATFRRLNSKLGINTDSL